METLELPLVMPEARSATGFRLHPALDAGKYELPGTARDVARWKAWCYVANSCGEDEDVAQMQQVGYVMVSRTDDTIVPIARGDEHHRGYDLLHDFASGEYATYAGGGRRTKGLPIRARDYVPVWAHGNNYVYGAKDAADMLAALRKWLSWGGPDGIVWGANDLRGRAMTSRQFVEHEGELAIEPGRLAPIGADVHARLTRLSETLVALGRHPARPALTDAYRQTDDLLATLKPLGYQIGLDGEWVKAAEKRLREVRRSGDSQELWEFAFGFSGLKNALHVHLRQETAKEWAWGMDSLRAIWGDPELAIDMLGRI
jgi:hypothetical protein